MGSGTAIVGDDEPGLKQCKAACENEWRKHGRIEQQYIDEAEQDLLHTYNRYQVVLDRGDGVSLYDIEGKRYLDFVAGIAVFALLAIIMPSTMMLLKAQIPTRSSTPRIIITMFLRWKRQDI